MQQRERRIPITGGEPTIRKDLCDIVARIHAIDGVEDIALSTNGVRLEAMATDLRGIPLESLFAQALADKPREHSLLQLRTGGLRALSQTGG